MYRVLDSENLFLNNTADLPRGDPADETPLTFCRCVMDINITQCGRKAVSDTTADHVEPSISVRLAVPLASTTRRRRRRQASDDEERKYYNDARVYSDNVMYAMSFFSFSSLQHRVVTVVATSVVPAVATTALATVVATVASKVNPFTADPVKALHFGILI